MANIERLHLSASSFQVYIINKRKEGMEFGQWVWLVGARIHILYVYVFRLQELLCVDVK